MGATASSVSSKGSLIPLSDGSGAHFCSARGLFFFYRSLYAPRLLYGVAPLAFDRPPSDRSIDASALRTAYWIGKRGQSPLTALCRLDL